MSSGGLQASRPCQALTLPRALCRTPLMLAIMNGHVDCVHLLLEKGSTADAADLRGRTALHRGVSGLRGGAAHSRVSDCLAGGPESQRALACLLQDEDLMPAVRLPDYLAL